MLGVITTLVLDMGIACGFYQNMRRAAAVQYKNRREICLTEPLLSKRSKKMPGQKTRQFEIDSLQKQWNHLPEGNSWNFRRHWEEGVPPKHQQ